MRAYTYMCALIISCTSRCDNCRTLEGSMSRKCQDRSRSGHPVRPRRLEEHPNEREREREGGEQLVCALVLVFEKPLWYRRSKQVWRIVFKTTVEGGTNLSTLQHPRNPKVEKKCGTVGPSQRWNQDASWATLSHREKPECASRGTWVCEDAFNQLRNWFTYHRLRRYITRTAKVPPPGGPLCGSRWDMQKMACRVVCVTGNRTRLWLAWKITGRHGGGGRAHWKERTLHCPSLRRGVVFIAITVNY